MDEPVIAPRESEAMPTTWPRSLVVPMAIALILLAFFTTLELPGYVHGRGVPRTRILIVFVAYACAIVAWISVESKRAWFARPSINRPSAWFRSHIKRLPLFVVFFIVLGYGLRLLGFSLLGLRFSPNLFGFVGLMLYEALKALLLYCSWLGFAFGVLSFATMQRQTERLLATQKTLMEAKLMRLQGQLRPHFLFNTLNTISSLMQVDVARADRLLTQLGDLLRANLGMSERNVVPLTEELQLLRLYAAIMEERFAGRVKVEWHIDAATTRGFVPTMLLQPLLENAFKHGTERNAGDDRIRVDIYRNADTLCIAIHNAHSTLKPNYGEGWGLRNCRERLQLLYGDAATLTLANHDGVSVTVTLPWIETA